MRPISARTTHSARRDRRELGDRDRPRFLAGGGGERPVATDLRRRGRRERVRLHRRRRTALSERGERRHD